MNHTESSKMGPIRNSKRYTRSGREICGWPCLGRQSIVPEPRHPMRQFTKRRERIAAEFMAAFRTNTENYARYGSQEWINSLIQHMDEKPHHNIIPEDVERWLRNESFFYADNLYFNYGSQRTIVGNTDQPEAPIASSHSSGSESGAVVAPEVVDIQDEADADQVMIEDAPKEQMINPEAAGDGDIAANMTMEDAPGDLKGEPDKIGDDLGIQDAPIYLKIKQEPQEVGDIPEDEEAEDVGDIPNGEEAEEDADGESCNRGVPATFSPDAIAEGSGQEQHPILMTAGAHRQPIAPYAHGPRPLTILEALYRLKDIVGYISDEVEGITSKTGVPSRRFSC